MHGRILQHTSVDFRQKNPLWHYRLLGLEHSKSTSFTLSRYGRDNLPGVFLSEAVFIAALALWQDYSFYLELQKLNVPAASDPLPTPFHRLNREPGLRYNFAKLEVTDEESPCVKLKRMYESTHLPAS